MSPLSKERVLVTGAAGFVGGRVVEALYHGNLAQPVAGIRRWSRAARPARLPIEVVTGDLTHRDDVNRLVANVDAIVHCASADNRETIVGGTENLLQAAAAHQVGRFVYLSTAEVYGPLVSGQIDEQSPTPPRGSIYADSKVEAEQLCQHYASQGVATTILRPSIIYGPFSSSWTVGVAQRLLSGAWAEFEADGDGVANLVYIDDLVQAICRALWGPQPAGQIYNINGPDRLTWNEYFACFNAALDLPPLVKKSATRARLQSKLIGGLSQLTGLVRSGFEDQLMDIYLRGGLLSRLMKRVKGAIDNTPSEDELHRLYSRQAIYSDAKARQQLQYRPQVDLLTGLDRSVAWLKHHEFVPTEPRTKNSATGKDQRGGDLCENRTDATITAAGKLLAT